MSRPSSTGEHQTVTSRIRPSFLLRTALAGVLALGAVTAGGVAASAAPAAGPAAISHVQRACSEPAAGELACLAEVAVPSPHLRRALAAAATVPGTTPAQIASAYGLKGGTKGLVAVVDAYDSPTLEADLAVYRKRFGLPACTTANHCFRKVDQRGGGTLPEADPGWGLEEALDVDAVSAACPKCSILVVEADEPTIEGLGEAVNTAVRLGAKAVSNSYGGLETTGVQDVGKQYYTHPRVPILAASGDDGFPSAISPATFSSVIAVGGTTLKHSTHGWKETVWEFGGSGCSAYIAKPTWQHDPHCPMRTIADVSALADPETGLATYDTFGTEDFTDDGWIQVGGTSLSTPLVSGMLVRSGKAASYSTAQRLYQRVAKFRDVTSGTNGACGGDSLCTAKRHWDAPSGVGAPRSLASF